MTRTAFLYTDAYAAYEYSDTHPLKPYRLKLTHDLIDSYGLLALPGSQVIETVPAPRAALELFHTAEYLDVLEAADCGVYRMDYGMYGLGPGDNPIFPGMYAWSQLCAGGTLQAARLVESGAVDVAFHIAGGLHHGAPDHASGFCYINDPVIAILDLMQKGYRVAYIDIDVHHGDGVQAAFYHTDRVLTISLHESGYYLFPGSGFVHEIGEGVGRGYAVNVPFPPGLDDDLFVEGFMATVPPLVEAFRPDFVLTQLGVDSFHDDPLAHGQVTTAGFTHVLRAIKALAPRWIATGGGGYNLPNVARAWTLAWAIMNDTEVADSLPETAMAQLQRQGYRGKTLRDARQPFRAVSRERLHVEVSEALAYLKRHVFPVHGLGTGEA
jgi:acetoin utilization protein AcuC